MLLPSSTCSLPTCPTRPFLRPSKIWNAGSKPMNRLSVDAHQIGIVSAKNVCGNLRNLRTLRTPPPPLIKKFPTPLKKLTLPPQPPILTDRPPLRPKSVWRYRPTRQWQGGQGWRCLGSSTALAGSGSAQSSGLMDSQPGWKQSPRSKLAISAEVPMIAAGKPTSISSLKPSRSPASSKVGTTTEREARP